MGFSRQGYWSGLPFPSPGHLPDPGIEPGSPRLQTFYHLSHLGSPKKCKVEVARSCLTLCDPTDYTVHGILQARILKWVAFPFSRDLPNPGIEPRSSTLQVDSLPAEPQGKPKNTGVGSLSADLPDPGIEPGSSALQADSLQTELSGKPLLE